MNEPDYNALVASLNTAVEILGRNRTPDPALTAAFDTLKQARAMVAKALDEAQLTPASARGTMELAAA